jgi:hypothetical protein
MTVRRFEPGLDPTQTWERSAEANSPSQGRARAVARHDQITRGDGTGTDTSGLRDFPPREFPNIV